MGFFLSYDAASRLKEVCCLDGAQEITALSVVDGKCVL